MLDHSRDYDFGQFKGHLDVEAAAVMGHSFGGGTTVLALHNEPRFRYHNNVNCFYCDSGHIRASPKFFWDLVGCILYMKMS